MIFKASAPSNLALVKYMGKRSKDNFPINSSLSITLDHLKTTVELEQSNADQFQNNELKLEQKECKRFLDHLKFLKDKFCVDECFKIKSYNNFPASSGFASSASSFAALTLAFAEFLRSKNRRPDIETLSALSRRGSGSSCRSFFAPWCLWDHVTGKASKIDLPDYKFIFLSVIISKKKKISSSLAHQIVQSSLLYDGRAKRAQERLDLIIENLKKDNWQNLFQLIKAEFWDMMGLFHTSMPGFFYIEPGSIEILKNVEKIWHDHKTGPLVTMDAASSVHLIFKPQDSNIALNMKNNLNFPYIYHES